MKALLVAIAAVVTLGFMIPSTAEAGRVSWSISVGGGSCYRPSYHGAYHGGYHGGYRSYRPSYHHRPSYHYRPVVPCRPVYPCRPYYPPRCRY